MGTDMNNLAFLLVSAFDAIDTASVETLVETVETLREWRDANMVDGWITQAAVDNIEGEVEIRCKNYEDDGEPTDSLKPIFDAVLKYNL